MIGKIIQHKTADPNQVLYLKSNMKIYVQRWGKSFGPYSEKSIREYLLSGNIHKNDWAWTKGAKEWVRLSDLILIDVEAEKQNEKQIEEYMNDQNTEEPIAGPHGLFQAFH